MCCQRAQSLTERLSLLWEYPHSGEATYAAFNVIFIVMGSVQVRGTEAYHQVSARTKFSTLKKLVAVIANDIFHLMHVICDDSWLAWRLQSSLQLHAICEWATLVADVTKTLGS